MDFPFHQFLQRIRLSIRTPECDRKKLVLIKSTKGALTIFRSVAVHLGSRFWCCTHPLIARPLSCPLAFNMAPKLSSAAAADQLEVYTTRSGKKTVWDNRFGREGVMTEADCQEEEEEEVERMENEVSEQQSKANANEQPPFRGTGFAPKVAPPAAGYLPMPANPSRSRRR